MAGPVLVVLAPVTVFSLKDIGPLFAWLQAGLAELVLESSTLALLVTLVVILAGGGVLVRVMLGFLLGSLPRWMLPVGLLLKCFNLGMEGCNLLLFLARDVPLVVEHPSVIALLLSLCHQSFCSEIGSFIMLLLELLNAVDKLLIFTRLVSLEEVGDDVTCLHSAVGELR